MAWRFAVSWRLSVARCGKANSCPPYVARLTPRRAQRRWRWSGMLETGWQSVDRYPGAMFCRHLYTWTHSEPNTVIGIHPVKLASPDSALDRTCVCWRRFGLQHWEHAATCCRESVGCVAAVEAERSIWHWPRWRACQGTNPASVGLQGHRRRLIRRLGHHPVSKNDISLEEHFLGNLEKPSRAFLLCY